MAVFCVGFYIPNPAEAGGAFRKNAEKSPRTSIGSIQVVDLTHSLQNGIPIWMDTWQGYTITGRDEWGWYENFLEMSEHTGTHMDAPAHRIEGGWTIDLIPLDHLSGICVTMDMRKVIAESGDPNYAVTAEDIEAWEDETGIEIESGHIVFMRTGWSKYWNPYVKGKSTKYWDNWPGLDESAATYLVGKGIKGFGIDTMSIDPAPSEDCPAHVTLYGENIWGLENLDNLGRIPTISYVFVAPMKIKPGSGAPTRVWAVFDRSSRGHENFAEDFDEELSAMSAYDLAHYLEDGIPIWMGTWEFEPAERDEWGWYENFLEMSEHTGTHMDAPAHRIEGGWTIDEIPLDHLHGSAVVMDMSAVIPAQNPDYAVTAEDIMEWEDATGITIQKGDIVFMYTGWYWMWDDYVDGTSTDYWDHWPAIDQTAAEYLVDKGIKGFGIDTMSVDPAPSEDCPVHVTLYGENIWGLENLDNLYDLRDSRCYVIVMPWMLWHGSGGPCRIVAFS